MITTEGSHQNCVVKQVQTGVKFSGSSDHTHAAWAPTPHT